VLVAGACSCTAPINTPRLFCSASRMKKFVSTPFTVPDLDSGCVGRKTGEDERVDQSMNRDRSSALHRVDVNRFFLASDYSSVAAGSSRRYVDDRAGARDDDPSATSYVRLDVLRIALVVVDVFIVMHRCACFGCCSCCCHSDRQLIVETVSTSAEVMRNGVAGSGIVLCSKHDSTLQQRKRRIRRAPNGSVSRPMSTFDVYDDEEDVDGVPDGLCRLCRRRRRRGVDALNRAASRRRVGGGSWRRRWTHEQRRRRRLLTSLLTRLTLCSIVLSLIYIVTRSLDVILVQLLTVATKQRSVDDLAVTETSLNETFAHQVRAV